METRPIFVLLGLLVAAGALAEAYTWTDDDGIVHYSDRPQPGAVEIELGNGNFRRPTPRPRSTPQPANDEGSTAPTVFSYGSFEVESPAAEETLWNIEGTLQVSLILTPPLRSGHEIRVYFDGKPQTVRGASFELQEVYRGVHNLQAEVLDETGKVMIRTVPNRFYVQQNSVF